MADEIIYNKLYTATVIASAPELGAALVMPTTGAATAGRLVVAYYETADATRGSAMVSAYPAGTTVLCARCYMNSMEVAYIVGACNNRMDPLDNSYGHRLLYNAERFTQSCKDAISGVRVIERFCKDKKVSWVRNHANGMSADMLPGDFDLLDKETNVGFHVGRFLAQLRGSATTFIDVSGLDGRLRLVGDSIEEHNMMLERVRTPYYTVDNMAMSASEAFGLPSGISLITDEEAETVSLKDEMAVPLYRMQTIAGSLAQGVERIVVGFPQQDGEPVKRHDADTEPPTLLRHRDDVTGETSSASAHSISFVKSPWIPSMTQLGYNDPDSVLDDLRQPHTAEMTPDKQPDIPEENDPDAMTDAAINKMVDSLLSGPYKEAMLKALSSHGLSIAQDKMSLSGTPLDPEAVGGATDQQQYDLPEHVDLKDPATGRTQRYYASLSFISQERDGSICIADGYGSEIRMCRGNIYISPALDLLVRPGRDMSAMVPRHLSMNAQGTATVNSKSDMYLRAVGNMKMAGATGGKGVVTLESRATEGPSDTGLPGLVLRSTSNTALTASGNMFIGRVAVNGKGKGKTTTPEGSGSIVIDAGSNGAFYNRGKTYTIDSGDLSMGAYTMDSDDVAGVVEGSVISVTRGTIGLYATSVIVPSDVYLTGMDTSVKTTLCRGGHKREALVNTTGSPDVVLQGNAVIGMDLDVHGTGMFRNHGKSGGIALSAFGIQSTTGDTQMDAAKKSTAEYFTPDREIEPQDPATVPMAYGAATSAVNASSDVYQDWFVTGNGFAFPDYNVSLTVVPGMLWQQRSITMNASDLVWKEEYLLDADDKPTACYPGYTVWENAHVSQRGGKKDAMLNNGGYAINSKL